MALEVLAGTHADVPSVQRLLAGARQWLRACSIDQWQDPIPGATIGRDAQQGQLFLVHDKGEIIASVTLADEDTETWGETSGDDAVYVHRLVIAQSHHGKRLGSTLLHWACERASAAGKAVVRLDCAVDNSSLRRFYEQEGFTHLRDGTVHSPVRARALDVSLYEKRLR